MQYEIMSRIDASESTKKADALATVIISITDRGSEKTGFIRRYG